MTERTFFFAELKRCNVPRAAAFYVSATCSTGCTTTRAGARS